jgi:hypothetical protein
MRKTIALVMVVAVCLASEAAGAGGPTGDAATIAFYRQVQSAYHSVQAITGTRRGFLSYTASSSAFRYYNGQKPPPGYRPATESLLYLIHNGRITKVVDTARAAGLPPLTIIEDASGTWANVSRQPGACYYKNPSIRERGQQFVGVFGNFSPLQHSGSTVIVRSTYPWGKTGAQASEVDRIAAATKLLLALQVHVNGAAPFSWSLAGLREEATPSLVLAPSPHC